MKTLRSRSIFLLCAFAAVLVSSTAAQAAPAPYEPVGESIATPMGATAVDPDSGDIYVETAKRTVTVFEGEAPYAEVTSFVASGLRDHSRGIDSFAFDGSGRLYIYGQDPTNELVVAVFSAEHNELAMLDVPGSFDRWIADPSNEAIYGTDQSALAGADESSLYTIRGTAPIEKTQVSVEGGTSFMVPDRASGDVFQFVTATNTLRVLDGETLQPTGDSLDLTANPLTLSEAAVIDPVGRRLFLLQRTSPLPDAKVRVFDIANPAAISELDPVVIPGGSATVQTLSIEPGSGSVIVAHGLYEGEDPEVPTLTVIDGRATAPAIVQEIGAIQWMEVIPAIDGRLLVSGYIPLGAESPSLVPFGRTEVTPPATINGGYADWGLKESFRNYIKGPIAKGQVSLAGGASANPDGTFRFPVEAGVHDPDGVGTEVDLSGSVHFTGHDHGAGPELDLTVSDPRIEVEGSSGTLYADVVSKSLTSGSFESFPDVDLAVLDLTAINPVRDDDILTWTAIPATLSGNGAPAFAGFYPAGTPLDPVTLVTDFGPAQPGPIDPGPVDPGGGSPPAAGGSPAAGVVAAPATAETPSPLLRKVGKSAKPNSNGVAAIATASCLGTSICTLSTPKRVKLKIEGVTFWAKVIAPRAVMAGASAKVKVKLPRAALLALGKGSVTATVRIVLRADDRVAKRVAKVKIVGNG